MPEIKSVYFPNRTILFHMNNEYTLSSEAGFRVRRFSGSCEGEKKVAYYPYSEDVTYDGTKIKL